MIYAAFLSKNKSNVLQLVACDLWFSKCMMRSMQTFRKYHFDFQAKQQK